LERGEKEKGGGSREELRREEEMAIERWRDGEEE
jgi:hypothetical protein